VIAGSNAAGGNMVFGNLPRSNTLKVLGLELLSVGDFVPVDGSYEVLSDADGERFAEFIFRDGQLVGAILIGHGPCHTGVKKAVEDGEGYASELASGLTACDLLDQFSR
jgi:NAD(P)H-nitrite reductase large subunit